MDLDTVNWFSTKAASNSMQKETSSQQTIEYVNETVECVYEKITSPSISHHTQKLI